LQFIDLAFVPKNVSLSLIIFTLNGELLQRYILRTIIENE